MDRQNGNDVVTKKMGWAPAWMRPLYDPAWGKGTARRSLILSGIFAVWLGIVLATIMHHEFWRDEVRPFSLAIASPSLFDLPEYLNNEGHPVVWYMLLRFGYQALGSYTALPVVSILIAGAAVLLFLFRSPFSLCLKCLFIFSVFPLYEYSVMARNYGISMLLMFCFAAVYPHRRRYPFFLAVILALLANTNVHSLMVAGILTVLWLWEETVVDQHGLSARRLWLLGLSCALILTAAIFAVKTALPDERTIATHALHAATFRDYLNPFVKVLCEPWKTMGVIIPGPERLLYFLPQDGVLRSVIDTVWHLLQILIIVALLLGLVIRARLALGLTAAFLAFGFLFNFVYSGQLRHQGIFLVFVLVLYWLNAEQGQSFRGALPARINRLVLIIVLPLLLIWGDCLAIYKVRRDFKQELSSCKALGAWLNCRPEYKDAIILGEPDYSLEALPYYAANRIFIPRESRFGNWVRFTTESRAVISLGELLDAAQGVKKNARHTTLLLLGFPAGLFEHKSSEAYSYNKVLVWTPSEWQRFKQSTKRVAGFWSSTTDENFDLYEVL